MGLVTALVSFIDQSNANSQGKKNVRYTATQVTPTSDEGVSCTGNFLGEHARSPVLAHDKRSSGDSNEKTQGSKSTGTVDSTRAGSRNGGQAQNDGHERARTKLVAKGTEKKAHKDGTSNTDDGRGPNLLLGKAESGTDLREERRNGEPDEKGDEETPPGAVEGSHVGSREVAELDFGRLVILVGIDSDRVRAVLLPARIECRSENDG